jgi:hypothetical protein
MLTVNVPGHTRSTDLLLTLPRHRPRGLRYSRISVRTAELPFQVGKCLDDFRSLKGAIAAADCDLSQDPRIDQTGNGPVCLSEAPGYPAGSAVDRDHWRADQRPEQ